MGEILFGLTHTFFCYFLSIIVKVCKDPLVSDSLNLILDK